jgi:hypothetical protein
MAFALTKSRLRNMTNSPTFAGKVTLSQRAELPHNSGIYFVTDERDFLLYIGKAKSLRDRWAGKNHHRYKQFARKGLNKIILKYILAPLAELDKLEQDYIQQLRPLLNDSKVKKYLPKKPPRFSELQRLLKLVSQPLFPSIMYQSVNGQVIPRENWDFFRGFVAGIYEESRTQVLIVFRQNMGEILWNSSSHRTKHRFFIEPEKQYYGLGCYFFDARQVIFVFVGLFHPGLSDPIFKEIYPHLTDCKVAEVTLKNLVDSDLLMSALQASSIRSAERDYLLNIGTNLKPLPTNFSLNQEIIW